MKAKFNIGVSPTRKYQKVNLELLEVEIEADTLEEIKAKVRQKFAWLRDEAELQLKVMLGEL